MLFCSCQKKHIICLYKHACKLNSDIIYLYVVRIYTKLKQVMPFDKIKHFHSELYNKHYTNAYKCSKNNIAFFF